MLNLLALATWTSVLGGSAVDPAQAQTTLIETEAFEDLGGWVLDQQFMDLMGSPFLLAHGMGVPVADASTAVQLAEAGEYRVWVRTRDWVAPWGVEGAPGKFEVHVNGQALETVFGTEGAEWHWQDGGVATLPTSFRLSLHDLTGFEGRCDAVLFSKDMAWEPPAAGAALEEFRREALGLPVEPVDRGEFDLVVVGGGVAGTCAAVTAARLGLTVALVQDRPVLGGNSSSEVRVWPEGHVNQMPFPRVGDVVMEVVPARGQHSANAQAAPVFDDDRKLRVARAEPNLTLFLERRMNGVETATSDTAPGSTKRAIAIIAEHVRTAERIRIRGRLFADCTGDGSLGALAGAEFEQTEKGHMGASNLWNIQCLCEDEDPLSSQLAAACKDAKFPRCPWAVDLSEKPFPGRDRGSKDPEAGANPISLGNWFWENGFDRDPITEMERVRDQNFRAMYGAWDAIKNVEGRYPAHRLNWVAYIAGKRESRRLLGDVILTGEDLRDGTKFKDGAFPCTWGIDTHHPHTKYKDGHDGDEFISDYTHGEGYVYDGPYWVPYRCLYSRNVTNLFMAGRDISVTHEALGAVRVMKTTGAMGEVVGMAASLCLSKDCTPRGVYAEHWDAMESLLHLGAGKIEKVEPYEEGRFILEGKSARLTGKSLRYESGVDSIGYWRTQGDYAEWAINAGQGGRFQLRLLASCVATESGGTALVEIQDQYENHPVEIRSTGAWSSFETQEAVEIELAPGVQRIRIKNGKGSGPLMKLRAVHIRPVPPVVNPEARKGK